jgi:hypothetical protein
MDLVSHLSRAIPPIGSCDNFSTDISERIHITNVKEADLSTNNVNYIRQMFKHNDRCTGLDFLEETLLYHAHQGWYDTESAKVSNLLSATDTWQSSHRAHLSFLQTIED